MQFSGRVLVVEDEPLIAEMLREWIIDLGCEVVGPAATTQSGLELLAEGPVNGAILDITIKDGPSYGIAKILQERGVPFAFATGHGTESIDPLFKNAPTLQKPFEFEMLAGVLAELMSVRQNGQLDLRPQAC